MSELINKKTVGRLLLIYKEAYKQQATFEEKISMIFGEGTIQEFENILIYIEKHIRKECGMPLDDIEGEWVFDMWYTVLYEFCRNEHDLDYVTDCFLNWNNR